MPGTVADEHKKGLTPSMQEVPNGALRLVQIGEECHAFAEKLEDGTKQLSMKVYSGGIIKGHWYWGDLAIDLEGLKFTRKKYPVLENHNTGLKIGFTGKPIVDGAVVLNPKTTKFVSTPESKEFQETSSEGFPYQASMYAVPSAIERIEEGESAKVNGFTLKGPGTIWRKAEFQEASVCVFGWDKQTEASVFSKDEKTKIELTEIGGDVDNLDDEFIDNLTRKGVNEVTIENIEQLTKEYPELVKTIQEAAGKIVKDETEVSFTKERDQFKTDLAKKDKELEDRDDRLLKLEKKDTIRSEKETANQANSVWTIKLVASDIPEHLYDKVRSMVKHTKFVKDEILDVDAYGKAIDAEIKDWVEKGVVSSSVLGAGFTASGSESEEPLAKTKQEATDTEEANKLLKLAGQEVKEKKAA